MEMALSNELMERFELFKSLEQNWDGDDADSVPHFFVDFAVKVVDNLKRRGRIEPTIGATPIGSIDLVWESIGLFIVLGHVEDGLTIVSVPSMKNEKFSYPDYSDNSITLISDKINSLLTTSFAEKAN